MKTKKYQKIVLFLAGIILLKGFIFFLDGQSRGASLSDLLTSALNSTNIVAMTNATRRAANLNELGISQQLEEAAQEKANDILKNQYFAHVNPEGKTPWNFMEEKKYNYVFAGENLAMNFNSAEEVTEGWLTSPGHRANILNDKYTEIGIGTAWGNFQGNQTLVVVQMFGRPIKSSINQKSMLVKKDGAKKITLAKSKKKNAKTKKYLVQKPKLVKGISTGKIIQELENKKLAQWNSGAGIKEIFAFQQDKQSLIHLLNVLYMYLVICGAVTLGYFFYIKKKRKSHAI